MDSIREEWEEEEERRRRGREEEGAPVHLSLFGSILILITQNMFGCVQSLQVLSPTLLSRG